MVRVLSLLGIFIFIEGSLTTLPFVLSLLLILMVLYRNETPLLFGLVAGIMLDVLTMRLIGISALFFLSYLFLIFLYDRKFEIASIPFVTGASFFGSILYLSVFHISHAFLQSLIIAVVIGIIFSLITQSQKYKLHVKRL